MAAKKSTNQKRKKTTQSQKKTEELKVEPVVSEPVVVEPVVSEPVVEPVVETVNSDNSEVTKVENVEVDETTFNIQKLNDLDAQITALQKERVNVMRALEKSHQKDLKKYNKSSRKRSDNPNRKPSGFAKPSLLSDELCKFIGKPSGTLMARTDVTKHITAYIKEHNLQDPEFKRRILVNKNNKLKKLLNVPKGQELTYFNLQTYMKVHFPKPVATSS